MAGKENPESGLIEEPVFIRGFDPASYKWTAPPKPSPWKRHFELGRANPGKWMKVSEVKKGGCRARLEVIQRDREKIRRYLDRQCPLERWTLRQVTVAGTWCDRELYMRYDGTLTPEQDVEDRARRQAIYQERNRTVIENRAKRAREAREKAAAEAAAEQVRIRSRSRPGG